MKAEDHAARNHGLVTGAEALASGLTEHQVRYRGRSGRWWSPRRGVHAIAGTPPSWEQQVLAAVLASGYTGMASLGTAARLHGSEIGWIDAIEVTTDRPRRVRLPGVVAHRSMLLFDDDRTVVAGIPCTTYARMLVDLSRRVRVSELALAVDAGLRRRKLTPLELHRCVKRLPPAPGRSPKSIEAVLAQRWPAYDPGESDLETRVIRLLVAAGLPLPTQQYRISVDGRRYRLDLAYVERKLAIELDGWEYHRSWTAFDRDRSRDVQLRLAGWTVLRFTSTMTDEFIVASIRQALGLDPRRP